MAWSLSCTCRSERPERAGHQADGGEPVHPRQGGGASLSLCMTSDVATFSGCALNRGYSTFDDCQHAKLPLRNIELVRHPSCCRPEKFGA